MLRIFLATCLKTQDGCSRILVGLTIYSTLQETPTLQTENQAIATLISTSSATVGDYLLSAITAHHLQDLTSLLRWAVALTQSAVSTGRPCRQL